MRLGKRLWLGLVSAALGSGLSTLSMAAGALTYGSLSFDENAFDFGEVFRGSELTHRFRFTNSGPGPLTIQGVHAACSCTAAEVDHGKKYQPGESGFVDVTLNTTDFSGPLSKTVTVMSNETLLPDRTLTLRAKVKSEVIADPPLIDFGEVRGVATTSRIVRIKAAPGKKLEVEGLDYNQEVLTASISLEPAAAGQAASGDWLLSVALKPAVRPGFLKETVTVKNSAPHLRRLPVPVRGMIIGHLELTPAYLEFGALAANEAAKRSVTLHGAEDFAVTGTHSDLMINGQRVNDASIYVKVEPQTRDKAKQDIAVELKNPSKQPGSVRGKLYITTTDPTQHELSVDFYALFR